MKNKLVIIGLLLASFVLIGIVFVGCITSSDDPQIKIKSGLVTDVVYYDDTPRRGKIQFEDGESLFVYYKDMTIYNIQRGDNITVELNEGATCYYIENIIFHSVEYDRL